MSTFDEISTLDTIVYNTIQELQNADVLILQLFDNAKHRYIIPVFQGTTDAKLRQILMQQVCGKMLIGYDIERVRLTKIPEVSFPAERIC